jgi:hypothetical protein
MVKKRTHFWEDVKDLMVSCIWKTVSLEFIDFTVVVITTTVIYNDHQTNYMEQGPCEAGSFPVYTIPF